MRSVLRGGAWLVLIALIAVPLFFAATSPLLAWREPVYIAAGLAGVLAMACILLQPLLASGTLPGIEMAAGRRAHRWVGTALLTAVLIHVGGLWITSPPDVLDALTFASPTPFSIWGVIAMWAVLAAAFIAALRKRLGWRPQIWRALHTVLVLIVAGGTIAHALLITGTMETVSKVALSLAIGLVLLRVILLRKVWRGVIRR